MRRAFPLGLAVLLALASLSPVAVAAGSGSHGSYSTGTHGKAAGVPHASHGKIARDPRQTQSFKKQHPCPATGKTYGSCPSYVIDHGRSLAIIVNGASGEVLLIEEA